MKIQIIGDEIFANGEKVAVILNDPKKSNLIDDFKYEVDRRAYRWN